MNPLETNLSRRAFLRRSTLTAAGAGLAASLPNLITRPAWAAASPNPIREGVRLGCIGVGNQGKPLMLQNYQNVVAVCDVDKDRAAAALKEIETRRKIKCPS